MTNLLLDLEPGKPGHLPFTIIIVTRNEENNIGPCLKAIANFAPVIVVDSGSKDKTKKIARQHGAHVHDFTWNGRYPKKRQWVLDNIPLAHDWVLFLDADERMPQKLKNDLIKLFKSGPAKDGYFIKSLYKIGDHVCRYGMRNNKLCLFNIRKMAFPVVDDLACPGMGEIEGHYQPVSQNPFEPVRIGRLKSPLIHLSLDDRAKWTVKHENYAAWAACMTVRKAWPADPDKRRDLLKRFFRALPCQPFFAFIQSYVVRLGFLDGKAGWTLARSRASYYAMIRRSLKRRSHRARAHSVRKVPAH